MLKRQIGNLESLLEPGKVLVIYGPRQVGKTTLIHDLLKTTSLSYQLETGDNTRIQQLFEQLNYDQIIAFATGYNLLILDEAQLIPNIGKGLKILVDYYPNLKIIATGSSSFELAGQIGEPLTGRKKTITLYPFSQQELIQITINPYNLKSRLEEWLIFGSYPEVALTKNKTEKIQKLDELVNSYLFKDILALENLKGSSFLFNLTKLLAFQVGQLVSLNELANTLGADVKTVNRYLDLLEKAFVIIKVSGFSRNLRNEINTKSKYYFLDNGVRNSIIQQYNPISSRNDLGQLFENFFFIERLKFRSYNHIHGTSYFWRNYHQQEIDLIEDRDGKLHGFESKWNSSKLPTPPSDWQSAYPNASYQVVNQENYLSFLL